MAKKFDSPALASTGKQPAAPAPAPKPAPEKASSDPAKASSDANIKTTFGTPADSM